MNGEEELNIVRDKARNIASNLGMEKEFKRLDEIISALLATHPSKILTSPVATARAFGLPYDPARIELFEILFQELNQHEFQNYAEMNTGQKAFRNFAFFESYFSNYIEGTQFTLNEAGSTVFVDPGKVEGTLVNGFEIYKTIPEGIKRALFIHF